MNCQDFFEGLVAHGFVSEYRRNGVVSLQCRILSPVYQTINRTLGTPLGNNNSIYNYFPCLGFQSPQRVGNTYAGMITYVLCPHTIDITINKYRRDILPFMRSSLNNTSLFRERVARLAAHAQYVHNQINDAVIHDLNYPTHNTPVEQDVLDWVMRRYFSP
ncbi:hypothetical protein Xedl_03573 [Xenorhabdus eapokensis]|uniref:Uncharacterized protein n=1 Tax=Xenorhabdus eapokensis TaxID=1873482 RepID=A0A1Q5THL4_9GAMM|nr:hypothetical protein Xedl_03573 [Xenorhabdus eapokensis]